MLTSAVRQAWAPYRCRVGAVLDPRWTQGRKPIYLRPQVHQAGVAFFAALLNSGYVLQADWPNSGYIGSYRRCPSGIAGHECESNGKWCSLHNYCLAIDLEYDLNPHLHVKRADPDWLFARCKLSRVNVVAVESIKTTRGSQVWKWLGWSIGDTMHFQINVKPDDVEIDWSTVLGWDGEPPDGEEEEKMFVQYRDGFGTDGDEKVRYWQMRLVSIGQDTGGVDGKYGDKTRAAVAAVVPASDGMQIHALEAVGIDTAFIRSLGGGDHQHNEYAKVGHIHDERYARIGHQHTLIGKAQ